MKEIIKALLKKYYSLGMTTKDVIILGSGAKTVTRLIVNFYMLLIDI